MVSPAHPGHTTPAFFYKYFFTIILHAIILTDKTQAFIYQDTATLYHETSRDADAALDAKQDQEVLRK